jgi:hypothetical protein
MRRAGMLSGLMSLVAITAIGLNADSSSAKVESRQAMEAPKPGPEMQRLNFLIGTWDMQAEYLKTPMTGDGGKASGWYKAQLGPGGFSVIADFEENGPLGKEIGHEIFSWDPKKNAYAIVIVGNFPGAAIGSATWEGDNLVILNEFDAGGTKMHLRAVYLHPGGKSVQIEESSQAGDAPYVLIYKATATKK